MTHWPFADRIFDACGFDSHSVAAAPEDCSAAYISVARGGCLNVVRLLLAIQRRISLKLFVKSDGTRGVSILS